MTPDAAARHYRAQQRLAVATVVAARRAWAAMTGDFDASWETVARRLIVVTVAAQTRAAQDGADYLPAVLAETDQPDDPAGTVVPRAFAGVASDGRSLAGLLYGAVIEAKRGVAGGAAVTEALARGGRQLDLTVSTLVADANRDAVQVGIASRPFLTGYVRMLNPPSCGRCAVLAGKWFRWNQGFLRHPRCDCRHIPSGEDRAGDFRTDPKLAFERGQVRGLSRADTLAIQDGASVGQVVNAQRDMRTVTAYGRRLKITTEGTTLRGVAGRRLAGAGVERLPGSRYRSAAVPRLRPESIYQVADSREQAIELLKRFGYIT